MLNEPRESHASIRPIPFWRKVRQIGLGRLTLICTSVGVGLGLCLVSSTYVASKYMNQPTGFHVWPVIEIPAIAIKAELQSEWAGTTRYQLSLSPLSEGLIKTFDTSKKHATLFTIVFKDKSGFEICSVDVIPAPVVNDNNKITGLTANVSFGCSRDDYLSATGWDLKWVSPKLNEEAPATPNETDKTPKKERRTTTKP